MPDALPPELPVLEARLPRRPRGRSLIGIAVLVSLGVHVAVLAAALLLAPYLAPAVLVPVGSPPVVELVMSPPGGEPHPAPPPRAPQPNAQAAKPDDRPAQAAAKPSPSKPEHDPKEAGLPPEPAPAEQKQPAAAQPVQSATAAKAPAPTQAAAPQPAPTMPVTPDDKLTIDLAQAESDTNAWVTGNSVLPPTADVKYHNRKPSYPDEAARLGEQGTVLLLIHVGADGLVKGVDVLRSSGFPALDRAARDAVLTWHFLPSVQNGQPIPGDMPARFVFELD